MKEAVLTNIPFILASNVTFESCHDTCGHHECWVYASWQIELETKMKHGFLTLG